MKFDLLKANSKKNATKKISNFAWIQISNGTINGENLFHVVYVT